MSLSVIGSVRARETPDPNEYSVSGVLAYSGRGSGENMGENMPAFLLLASWRQCVTPGDCGDGIGAICMPRPGSMFS
jgi:hypothetical protein